MNNIEVKSSKSATNRVIFLECLRGFASFNILTYHLATFIIDTKLFWELQNGPLFPLLNGVVALKFFFLLSGYVLTLEYFKSESVTVLISRAIRRYPRLVVPVFLSAALSYGWGEFVYQMCTFYSGAKNRCGYTTASNQIRFEPMLRTGLLDWVVKIPNCAPQLWTLRFEILGSALSFALAYVYVKILQRRTLHICICALTVSTILSFLEPKYLPESRYPLAEYEKHNYVWHECFLVGTLLSFYHSKTTNFTKWSTGKICALLALAYYICCFPTVEPEHIFRWSLPIYKNFPRAYSYIHIGASVIFIEILHHSEFLAKLLSSRVAQEIGTLSFPLYLTHLSVITASVTCFDTILDEGKLHKFACVSVSLVVTLILTLLVSLVDRNWAKLLNQIYKYLENKLYLLINKCTYSVIR